MQYSHIFREYDIRGTYEETLFAETAFDVGRGYGTFVSQQGGKALVVGRDGRLSSPLLTEKLIEGIRSTGIHVIFVGVVPTPAVYYGEIFHKTDGSIMVTGSHNPPQDNGFKLTFQREAFAGQKIKDLLALIQKGKFSEGQGSYEEIPIEDAYIERLLQDIETSEDLRVVWDPGNGATGQVIEKLAKKLPGAHWVINGTIDGTFPAHHPDPTVEKNLVQLVAAMKENNAHVGLAFDGDGDRLGVVDQKGRLLWGDQLLTILAFTILEKHPGSTIIGDIKTGLPFQEVITQRGGVPLLWKTGHSHIKEKINQTPGALLAGEVSGHLFFKDRYYGYDDGVYGALRVLEQISTETLENLTDTLPQTFVTPELRFFCDEEKKFSIVAEIVQQMQQEGLDILTLDGVRYQTPEGWWLIRASNTQAVLVARVEGKTEKALEGLKEDLLRRLRPFGFSSL